MHRKQGYRFTILSLFSPPAHFTPRSITSRSVHFPASKMVPRTAIVTVAIILAVITRQATAYPQQLQRTRHHHPSLQLQLHATAVPYLDQVASISAAWDDLISTNQPQRVAAAHPHVDAALRSFDAYDASTDTGNVLFPAQPDDAAVLDVTRRWVQAVIADFAVCPFTVQVCAPFFSSSSFLPHLLQLLRPRRGVRASPAATSATPSPGPPPSSTPAPVPWTGYTPAAPPC